MRAPHKILGIPADADEATIKNGFRRLAMALHPDRNPDQSAGDQFKTVRAAYEAMMAALRNGEANAELNEEGSAQNQDEQRGEDLHRDLELTLEEAAFGCQKTLALDCSIPCARCEGSGESDLSRSQLCAACQGSGRLRAQGKLVRCSQCDGRGFITSRACPDCNGSGRQPAERHLQVHVPAGVVAGSELRLADQGREHPEGGAPGHLYLKVSLLPHALFHPLGQDLLCSVPVSMFRWLAGGKVSVPLLGGKKKSVTLTAATSLQPEPTRLKGCGLPGRGHQPNGDLLVSWKLVLPTRLSPEQIELMEAAERHLQSNLKKNAPELAAWKEKT
ncbi:MAG: Chaperone protein DnaJ [Betaproteobacteria bacterium ADurb.Bin341]|nr:MAG: Chaperone protein DnaJ [Betaproteobacteria bacterium ADurb.Bin341]